MAMARDAVGIFKPVRRDNLTEKAQRPGKESRPAFVLFPPVEGLVFQAKGWRRTASTIRNDMSIKHLFLFLTFLDLLYYYVVDLLTLP